MTLVYLNQPAYSLPLADHQKEDKNHLFSYPCNQDPTSPVSCPASRILEGSRVRDTGKQRHDQEADMNDWSSVCGPKYEKDKEEDNRSSMSHKDSAKWMCSETSMQKMKPSTSPDNSRRDSHKASSYSPTWQHQRGPSNYKYNNGNYITRICADCNATSTPLWRSGPNGPKSLCNACGIRRRKARKAMEEAGNVEGRWCAKTRIMHNREKKTQVINNKWKGSNVQSLSRGKRKVGLHDFEFSLSRRSSHFQRPVFPRDEALEGAMLLVDLSFGFSPF